MLNSGIRDGKKRDLTFDDIDFKNRIVLVTSSKTKDFRKISLNDELEKTLRWLEKSYISPNSDKYVVRMEHQRKYVFCNKNGSQVLKIKNSLNSACKKAGLKGVTPHILHLTWLCQEMT